MITIFSKDVGEVRERFRHECEVVRTFEDRSQDSIKFNMGIRE